MVRGKEVDQALLQVPLQAGRFVRPLMPPAAAVDEPSHAPTRCVWRASPRRTAPAGLATDGRRQALLGHQFPNPLVSKIPDEQPRDFVRVDRQGRHDAGVPA